MNVGLMWKCSCLVAILTLQLPAHGNVDDINKEIEGAVQKPVATGYDGEVTIKQNSTTLSVSWKPFFKNSTFTVIVHRECQASHCCNSEPKDNIYHRVTTNFWNIDYKHKYNYRVTVVETYEEKIKLFSLKNNTINGDSNKQNDKKSGKSCTTEIGFNLNKTKRVVIDSEQEGCIEEFFEKLPKEKNYSFSVCDEDNQPRQFKFRFSASKNEMRYPEVMWFLFGVLTSATVFVVVGASLFLRYRCTTQSTRSEHLDISVEEVEFEETFRVDNRDIQDRVTDLLDQGMVKLREQFSELGEKSPVKRSEFGKLPSNAKKNRYKDILPFDDYRVLLSDYRGDACSDYINASYIHGWNIPNQYIASQGPTDDLKDDFWRMTWEKGVRVIVMLTKTVEGNLSKCSKYWPEMSAAGGLVLTRAGLVVTTMMEMNRNEVYVARKICLCKGRAKREVHHYQFLAWPDKSCPAFPDDLLKFILLLRNVKEFSSFPVLVHCSAGVGRTGTFIAFNNLVEEMESSGGIDIFSCVHRMRQQRPYMVQTLVITVSNYILLNAMVVAPYQAFVSIIIVVVIIIMMIPCRIGHTTKEQRTPACCKRGLPLTPVPAKKVGVTSP